mgnify:CR=1 FL=1
MPDTPRVLARSWSSGRAELGHLLKQLAELRHEIRKWLVRPAVRKRKGRTNSWDIFGKVGRVHGRTVTWFERLESRLELGGLVFGRARHTHRRGRGGRSDGCCEGEESEAHFPRLGQDWTVQLSLPALGVVK